MSSHRPSAMKARVNLSMTWDHPSMPEADNLWDTTDGAMDSLNYDASASASFQPSPAPTSLSLTAPILSSIKFPAAYLHVDTDSSTGQGSTTYMLSDIAPALDRLTITTTSSEGEESGRRHGVGNKYASSSSMASHPTATAAVGSSAALSAPCRSPVSASSSSSLSLPSPPMSPTSSDYTRALRELEELAREEDWMTSASEYESDAEVRRGRERSRSGEKERSDLLLAPRNYIASSLFSSNATTTAAPTNATPATAAVTGKAVLSASASAPSTTPAPSMVSGSASLPSASLPPLPPHKASVVAFTIQKKPLPSASSPHSAASPPSLSPAVTPSSTSTTLVAHSSPAGNASGSSPSHNRTLSRQARRRTAEPGTLMSRPSSRPDSVAGSRANSPPRGNSPQTVVATLAAAPAADNDEDSPPPTARQMKRASSSRRRTWNHTAANGQDESLLALDLLSASRRSSLHRTETTVTASPSLSVAASAVTSPRASLMSAAKHQQLAQTDSESLKQRRAKRQLSHSWMHAPVTIEVGDAGFDSAPLMLVRRRSRSHSRSRSGSRSLLNDTHAIASTSSASSSSSAVEPMHRRQQSTPHISSSCPVLPPCATFHGNDTRASSLPSPLTPSSAVPLPSPPPLTSPSAAMQAQGDKVALVLEGRQIAVLSLAAVQQLLEGHRAGKDDGGERDGRGSRSGRRRSAKASDEMEELGQHSRRHERLSDDSDEEEDRTARVRLQSQRRRSQKRLSVRTSKTEATLQAALHRREHNIDA